MLTRKSASLDNTEDWTEEFGLTMDEFFELPKDKAKALEQAWARDYELAMARLEKAYDALTPLQKYRYDRRSALELLLRTRTRLDKYRDGPMKDVFGFMVPDEEALLKKWQHKLIDLRRRLRTGIGGGNA